PSKRPIYRRRSAHLLAPMGGIAVVLALSVYLFLQYVAFMAGSEPLTSSNETSQLMLSTPIPTATAIGLATVPTMEALPTSSTSAATPVPTIAPIATATLLPLLGVAQAPTPTASRMSGVLIEATMVGRVWVQVESDGQVIFSGILNA